MEKGNLIHRIFDEKGQLIMPGVCDALSAKREIRYRHKVQILMGFGRSMNAVRSYNLVFVIL